MAVDTHETDPLATYGRAHATEKRGPLKLLSASVFLVACCQVAFAQSDTSKGLPSVPHEQVSSPREFIHFPKELPAWTFVKSLGCSVAYIPNIIAEEEIDHAPLVDFNMRLGLPYNFSANASVSTIGITNQFLIGGQWSYSIDRLSFALGYDITYWLGFFRRPAFDVVANGTMNYPFVSIGFDFGDFYVSLRAEAQYMTFTETFVGDASVGGVQWELAGFGLTYSLEQPFWKNTHIVQSVKISYAKFFYQSWISFTTVDRYFIYPEFIIGILL